MADVDAAMSAPEGGGLAKAYRPGEFEGPIYSAGSRRTSSRRTGPAPARTRQGTLRHHPAAANVTGSLHLGHAQRSAVEDLMIRHARMLGRPALFLPGLDHASIAAQVVLTGSSPPTARPAQAWAVTLPRADVAPHRREPGRHPGQQRRLGASMDSVACASRWTTSPAAPSARRSSASTARAAPIATSAHQLVPGLRTSLSDLEVIATPETGTLWTIRYHLVDEASGADVPDAFITVATTRPETILATPASRPPGWSRYRDLVGRHARIPFVDRVVPIIADAVVDPAFARGPGDHPGPRQRRLRDGRASRPAVRGRDRRQRAHLACRRPVCGPGALRRPPADFADREAAGDLVASRAHQMIIGRCQRSPTWWSPGSRRSGSSGPPRWRRRVHATRTRRTVILPDASRRSWSIGLPRFATRCQPPALVGHRIPVWYLPGRPRDGERCQGGPLGLRRVRARSRRADPGS